MMRRTVAVNSRKAPMSWKKSVYAMLTLYTVHDEGERRAKVGILPLLFLGHSRSIPLRNLFPHTPTEKQQDIIQRI
jgi:hypothetical protein